MIKRIALSHILVFFLLSSAIDAQSSSPPAAASPNATLPNRIPSFDPTVAALVCVFLFVGCFSIYLRHCSNIYARRSDRTANFDSTGPQGIDPKLLDTFPILPCSAVKQLRFGSATPDCAVCLAEFDHHDKLRLLPKCNHVFHSECIDAWLASHVTCPVCRTRLKPAEEHHHGENEVVIVIPNEVINERRVFDGSSVSGTEADLGDRRSLGRCHSTGHSVGLGEIGMKDTERYDLRSEDLRKQIAVHHGGMRRSVSYDVFR
ncbi:E3 ubiquitin-protein ligase ATL6 [Neltuma alba]|uniref:E3 ubiquitin-protein ligase ATL6 n=1 Tax=Neltuma alba TaxID=207710 RepID=UPI0010A3D86F|nr:E3 ubiquitin-protein ligase ATL6-like [Prosopis alba]